MQNTHILEDIFSIIRVFIYIYIAIAVPYQLYTDYAELALLRNAYKELYVYCIEHSS